MDDVRKHELRQLAQAVLARSQSGSDYVEPIVFWEAGDNKIKPLTVDELIELLDE